MLSEKLFVFLHAYCLPQRQQKANPFRLFNKQRSYE